MEAIQVFERDFDSWENQLESARFEVLLGTFIGSGTLSAQGVADDFIQNLPMKKRYLGWDGEVYPKILIKRILIYEAKPSNQDSGISTGNS